jgi:hypothetical protein
VMRQHRPPVPLPPDNATTTHKLREEEKAFVNVVGGVTTGLTCASRSVFWVPGMGRPNCKLGSRLSSPPTLPRFMGARSTCQPTRGETCSVCNGRTVRKKGVRIQPADSASGPGGLVSRGQDMCVIYVWVCGGCDRTCSKA